MKATILVIEDDDASRQLVTYLLEAAGHRVLAAENGALGLGLALAEGPDLILCDLQMPVMNGYEFIEAFALMDLPDKSAITIVVLTSSADPNDLARAKELGIKYYFNKPLTREEIKKMIGQEFSYDLN